MTETLTIPLNKLIAWDGNVRKTGVTEGIEELAASIAAHGLLQSPIVRKVKGGKYAVVAGQRRLLALKLLAEQGTIVADMGVPCQLAATGVDAGEISLAENVVRVAMHPADQFSAALIADLTAQKTAALRVALARNVPVALAATVHAMALQAFYAFGAERSCLQITLRETMPERLVAHADGVKALQDNTDEHALWADQLPSDPADLWPWCLTQTQDMLLLLMAFVTAQSVDAVRQKADRPDCGRLVSADALAGALNLDTASWFTPGADNYFGRISSAQIIAALCEAKSVSPAPSWAKMKKADLAAFAAREIAGTGWLPETLRIPVAADDMKAAA